MSSILVDRNKDLKRLRDEGYSIEIHGAHLVLRDIPYVNERREVKHDGVLVSSLELNGEIANRPTDHTVRFAGDCPCTSEGVPIEAIRPLAEVTQITNRLTTQFTCSSKPVEGYADYYHKMKTYVGIMWGWASKIDPDATPLKYRVIVPEEDNSPFVYLDTASARAEINVITQKLAAEKIAIVGLGGTGSYILDLLSKTPIKEIHLFDDDKFSSHNAFRAPGAASIDDLHKQMLKVEYFKAIYDRLHKNVVAHEERISEENIELLRSMDFIFLCLDSGVSRKAIVAKLEELNKEFLDVGMGLQERNGSLSGILRVTTSQPDNRETARGYMSLGNDDPDDEYDRNIQIADLNALNATLAVIKWKKMRGFYADRKRERQTAFTIPGNLLTSDDLLP